MLLQSPENLLFHLVVLSWSVMKDYDAYRILLIVWMWVSDRYSFGTFCIHETFVTVGGR